MFGNITAAFKNSMSKEQIAQLLNTTPEALEEFEKAYHAVSDEENKKTGKERLTDQTA